MRSRVSLSDVLLTGFSTEDDREEDALAYRPAFMKYLPQTVTVQMENMNVTLSLNSQQRYRHTARCSAAPSDRSSQAETSLKFSHCWKCSQSTQAAPRSSSVLITP